MTSKKQFDLVKGKRKFNFRSKNDETESVQMDEVIWKEISGADELATYMENPDKTKPAVTIIQDARVNVPLLDLVNGGLRACSLDGNLAAAFLHEVASSFKQILEEDYIVDGIKIGEKGKTVNPLHLLTVTVVPEEFAQLKTGTVARGLFSQEVAVFLICFCHRMASAGALATTEYLTELANRATSLLSVFPYYAPVDEVKNILAAGATIGNEFLACKSCSILVAAYDMFLRTFEHQKFSSITMSTLQSYCRDYTVFIDLKFMTDVTGLEYGDWAQWIWVPEIHEEMHNLAKILGFGKMRLSYFPYLRSMDVISRSPLAATVSPHLHTFIHATGILRGEARSINARMVAGGIHYVIFKNVRVFLMALGYRTEIFRMGVFSSKEDENTAKAQEAAIRQLRSIAAATVGQRPKLFNATHWLTYAVAFPRLKVPGSVDACKVVLDCIEEPRPGTVAAQMKVEIREAMTAAPNGS
ncbi:nucleocapsid [Taishun Tick Virus]|uniref:Nucleoprotein n=1 Tax=Taishun Tick Virus TaxID=1608090 RepID=A0A0B5KEY6_9RHAB|nr:nucleocapsid [Taishun Tick Virus]AJG39149.1 nucleocapsid [Taishun Tick Virus]